MPDSVFQRRVPRVGYAWTVSLIFTGFFLSAAIVTIWRRSLPALQDYYCWTYARYAIGSTLPSLKPGSINRFAALYQFLYLNVFSHQAALVFFRPLLITLGICLAVCLFFGFGMDQRRLNNFRKGKRLRGMEVVTPKQFNRATKGDGFELDVL